MKGFSLIATALCLLYLCQEVSSFQLAQPVLKATIDTGNLSRKSIQATKFIKQEKVQSLRPPHILSASATDSEGGGESPSKLDTDALAKYAGALVIQVGLIAGLFTGLDKLVAAFDIQVPFALNCFGFYAVALKSRIFNPLSNKRPQTENKEIEGAQERKMPNWTPPGFIFPIVWLLLIGPLRAFSTSLIYDTTGSYAHPAILSLMLHLSIGDIWNTINNVERRYGASVLGVLCVWISAAFAAFNYYQVLPLAGQLLSLKLIWLTIASSLIFQTWRLNPDPETGKKDALMPTIGGDAKTEFMWF